VSNSVLRQAVHDYDEDGLVHLSLPLLACPEGRGRSSRTSPHRTPARTPRRSRTPPPRRSQQFSRTSRATSEADAGADAGPGTPLWLKSAAACCAAAYLAAAVRHDRAGALPLLLAAGAAAVLWGLRAAWRRWGAPCGRGSAGSEPRETDELGETGRLLRAVFVVALVIAAGTTFVMLDVLPSKQWNRLVSLGGIGVIIGVCWALSDAPRHVVWRPVLWGLAVQFSIAALMLKWSAGFEALNSCSTVVMEFLSFAEEGAKFVYGDSYQDHYFAFVVLSIIIFFGSFIGVCYHLGLVQYVIDNVSYLMSVSFQVSGVDAVGAIGNMFVGPCESALLVKPFLFDLTKSELQSLMIAGMGSTSGGSLAAYIGYGIPIDHVLLAVMLSAPASIMVAKVLCPEREESKARTAQCPPSECTNVVEAAAQGAADCIPLVLNIGGIMLAFISLLALLDACLGYLGSFVGLDDLSFNLLCSYAFRPLAFLIGVPWQDCATVAELLGKRCFLNDFVAYEAMGEHMKAGDLHPRSVMLSTYALCGFSNFATIGVLLGGLSPLIPHRSQEIAQLSFRSLVGGTATCLITACVAGFLVEYA